MPKVTNLPQMALQTRLNDPAAAWEQRYWRQTQATNKIALKEQITRQKLRRLAELVVEHTRRNGGDTYLAQEAAAALEQIDR